MYFINVVYMNLNNLVLENKIIRLKMSDGIDRFDTPPEHKGGVWEYYHDEKKSIKTHILDEHIWWFRK